MKPSNEEKARFFALYWGQKIGRRTIYFKAGGTDELKHHKNYKIEGDLIATLDKFHPAFTATDRVNDYLELKEGRFEIEEMEQTGSFDLRIADYLRSKGYALPWMGISVDDQVKYGWIKLKQQ